MSPEALAIRGATPSDAQAVAAIFNQGIAERVATFETREQTPGRVANLLEARRISLVAEVGGTVAGFAWIGPYDDAHDYYDDIGEATVYVERGARRTGVGRALIEARAGAAGAGLVVLPELVISGYPPEDLLLKAHFLDGCRAALDDLAARVAGIVALIGFPERDLAVHNSLAVVAGGRVEAVYRKALL